MNILSVHSSYALRGGEDEVREAERDLLRQHGHEVAEYTRDNTAIKGSRPWAVGVRTIWSQEDFRGIRARIRAEKSQIVVVHNFFPLISPAVYYAAHAEGVPVVQTLHNFRLICPAAVLLRDGVICEDCVGKAVALPGVVHGCYRGSRVLSAGVAGMISTHKLAGTWHRVVDRYVALTSFMRDKFIEGGFPGQKIDVKANFTEDRGVGTGSGGYFIFAGRLSAEKGVSVLLRAWKLAQPAAQLRIIGSGPEELSLRAQASSMPNVIFLGQQTKSQVLAEIGEAAALIVPSIWYEAFGLITIEALSRGTPVIASRLGALPSLVRDGENGYLFEGGSAEGLAEILRTWDQRPELRAGARNSYERGYTPERNYAAMMEIYTSVIEHARR